MPGRLIVLVGKSGSGKSTMAKRLREHLTNNLEISCQVIDQDSYWSRNMPTVTYESPDGERKTVKLYDSEESVNWDGLGRVLKSALESHAYVIFTAFLLPLEKAQALFDGAKVHFVAEFDISDETSIFRRRESKARLCTKKSKPFDPAQDEWMVKTYTMPLYRTWISQFYKKYFPVKIGADLPEDVVWDTFFSLLFSWPSRK